jgi:non-ribosomal peptide synthase protein (TIGR01720 family)
LPAQAQQRLLSSVAMQIQKSLDLRAGPVARVGIIRLGSGLGDRLLVAAHHLVIDIVSWVILLEDLQRAYQQIRRGEAVTLPAATTTYRSWCERLAEYARGPEIAGEVEYWEKSLAGEIGRLPVDNPGGENREGTASELIVRLSQEQTEDLSREAGRAYKLQPGEALLVALGRALAQWSGASAVVVDVEGHGREELWADVDLTRTVGWFTVLYPMRLACGGDLGTALMQVKEQVRTAPLGGLGFGLLRYAAPQPLRERVGRMPRGDVSLNYVGRRRSGSGEETIRQAQESPGAGRSPKAPRAYKIDINAGIDKGRLWISWTYSSERYQRATIERLAAAVEQHLSDIAAHCRLHGVHTSSDIPLAAWIK